MSATVHIRPRFRRIVDRLQSRFDVGAIIEGAHLRELAGAHSRARIDRAELPVRECADAGIGHEIAVVASELGRGDLPLQAIGAADPAAPVAAVDRGVLDRIVGEVADRNRIGGAEAASRPPASARKVANRTVMRAASCMITLECEVLDSVDLRQSLRQAER